MDLIQIRENRILTSCNLIELMMVYPFMNQVASIICADEKKILLELSLLSLIVLPYNLISYVKVEVGV